MSFVYAICRPGSERTLKAVVARDTPGLRFAFSRPGLVTFRNEGDATPRIRSPFARLSGRSLGSFDDAAALARHLVAAHDELGTFALHVFEREPAEGATTAPEFVGPVAARLTQALAAHGVDVATRARKGKPIVDVVVAEGEKLFAGTRVPEALDWLVPGGLPRIAVPEDAPSRAFAKIEEALAWTGAPMRKGELVIEIGSAPGGVSDALVRRGMRVVGIDAGEMDPAFVARAGDAFVHVPKAMGAVTREEMPRGVAWIVLDVNLAPQVALRGVSRFVSQYRKRSLRGVFLTLKMNDAAAVAAIPAMLGRLREMGLDDVHATQLPSNRSEISVFATVAARGVGSKRA